MGFLYVDESGDCGFDLRGPEVPGASENFILGAVYFPSRDQLHAWRWTYRGWWRGTHRADEFKFADEKDYHRRGFLKAALEVPWTWNALVLRKERVIAKGNPEQWYKRSFGWLLETASQHAEKGTLVFADERSMSKERRDLFRREVARPMNTARPGQPKKVIDSFYGPVRFLDSSKSEGVQLADAVAGAVSLAHRSWRAQSIEYHAMLRARCHVCQVWPK